MKGRTQIDRAIALVLTVFIIFMFFSLIISSISPVIKGDPPFSENKEVSKDATNHAQTVPSIGVDSSGRIYVVWEDDRLGSDDIYFSKSIDGGGSWSSPDKKVSSDDNQSPQKNPSLAVTSSGGLYVAWKDQREDGQNNIYFASSIDGGASWTEPNVRINTDPDTGNQREPALAVDSTGAVYAVWQDTRNGTGDGDIYFAKSTNGGTTWTHPNVRVSTDTTNVSQEDPTIAVDSNDHIYVAWEDERMGNWDIFFAKSEDGGSTWTEPNVIVSNDTTNSVQRNPTIAVSSTSTIYVIWEDWRNDADGHKIIPGGGTDGVNNADIYLAKSTDGGNTWTKPNLKVNTDSGTQQQIRPSLAVGSGNILHVVWQDYCNGNSDIYYAESTNGGGAWTDPNIRVNDDISTADQSYPCLAADPNGAVFIAWQDERDGDYNIYFTAMGPIILKPTADSIAVEGFYKSTDGIRHILPDKPEFSFEYNDPWSDDLAQYNLSLWDEDGSNMLWFCNTTETTTSGSVVTLTYNTEPGPTHGPDLEDGTTYKLRVKVKNETGIWSEVSEADFHMNEVLAPIAPVSPLDDTGIEASSSQTVSWNSPGPDSEGDSPDSYGWQVATDSAFTDVIASGSASDTYSDAFSTTASTSYYWRVNLTDGWETSSYGNSPEGYWNFTTLPPAETNDPPTITNKEESPTTAEAGSPITHTFTAEDPDEDPLTWSIVSGPEWLEIGPTNGTIYGTPSPEDQGVNTFTIRVSDGKGRNDTFDYIIDVGEPTDGDDQDGDDDTSDVFSFMIPWLMLVILVIFLIILFILLKRRKRPEESEAPEEEPT